MKLKAVAYSVAAIAMAVILTLAHAPRSEAMEINQDISTGFIQILAYQPLGQSFTATDTDIASVGFYVTPLYGDFSDVTLTMSLFDGAGVFSGAALLATTDLTLSAGYSGWAYLDVQSVAFAAGSEYTIAVNNDTTLLGIGIDWGFNPYAGGVSYLLGTVQETTDLTFRVSASRLAAVPEPATLLVLGGGMLGLGLLRRRLGRAGR